MPTSGGKHPPIRNFQMPAHCRSSDPSMQQAALMVMLRFLPAWCVRDPGGDCRRRPAARAPRFIAIFSAYLCCPLASLRELSSCRMGERSLKRQVSAGAAPSCHQARIQRRMRPG